MLVVGMGTECVIFIISAFEPVHMDPDWSLVYPELAGVDTGKKPEKKVSSNLSVTQQLDQMLEEAKIGPELIQSLGNGLKSLSENVSDMSNLNSASVATAEYAANTQKAARTMEEITKSTGMVNDSLTSFSGGLSNVLNNLTASEGATAEFKEELGRLNKNIGNLNTIYGNMLSAMGGSR
jgi:gliding motility-associated protein GldL